MRYEVGYAAGQRLCLAGSWRREDLKHRRRRRDCSPLGNIEPCEELHAGCRLRSALTTNVREARVQDASNFRLQRRLYSRRHVTLRTFFDLSSTAHPFTISNLKAMLCLQTYLYIETNSPHHAVLWLGHVTVLHKRASPAFSPQYSFKRSKIPQTYLLLLGLSVMLTGPLQPSMCFSSPSKCD